MNEKIDDYWEWMNEKIDENWEWMNEKIDENWEWMNNWNEWKKCSINKWLGRMSEAMNENIDGRVAGVINE